LEKKEIENLSALIELQKNLIRLTNELTLKVRESANSLLETHDIGKYYDLEVNVPNLTGTKKFLQFSFEVPSQTNEYDTYFVEVNVRPQDQIYKPSVFCNCLAFKKNELPCKHIAASMVDLQKDIESYLQEHNADEIFNFLKMDISTLTHRKFKEFRKTPTTWKKTLTEIENRVIPAFDSENVPGSKDFIFIGKFTDWTILENFMSKRSEINRFPENQYEIQANADNSQWKMWHKANSKMLTQAELIGDNTVKVSNHQYQNNKAAGLVEMLVLLRNIARKVDPYWHKKINNPTFEKAKLLKEYGLTPEHPFVENFTWKYEYDGTLAIQSAPKGLVKIGTTSTETETYLNQILLDLNLAENASPQMKKQSKTAIENLLISYGLAFNFSLEPSGNVMLVDGVKIKPKNHSVTTVIRAPLQFKEDVDPYEYLGQKIFTAVKQLSWNNFFNPKYGHRITQSDFLTVDQATRINWNQSIRRAIWLIEMELEELDHLFLYLPEKEGVKAKEIPITYKHQPFGFKFKLEETEGLLSIGAVLLKDGIERPDIKILGPFLAREGDAVSLLPEDLAKLLDTMPSGKITISSTEKQLFIRKFVLPLSKKVEIDFNGVIEIENLDVEPHARIYLSELEEKYLLFKPRWKYGEVEIENTVRTEEVLEWNGKILQFNRKTASEKTYIEALRSIHPSLAKAQTQLFYINFKDALLGQWFLGAYQKLSEAGFEILGFDQLKRFKYSTYQPKMKFGVTSGIDWFDVNFEVSYGDEIVPMEVLRQAFSNGSPYLVLGDGSLGMLPEEWLKKFATLFKFGKLDKATGDLKIKKFHWTVIDTFYGEINDLDIQRELTEKKEKLKSIDNIREVKLPEKINATLRDYQVAGFQWMSLLDELNWAGCLADDMGLGKTLQTITFLQHLQNKNPNQTHLIVCPTSLIFNWENELKKFAPSLDYHIHYGSTREWNEEHFEKHDLVITSYGNLRSDIEKLMHFSFGYVILDESQAIKNPSAQISKSVRLLKARNRMALSGTPVQNNTFDLYSQFDFLNPGLLGNQEFFREEFANPIDKEGNKEKTEMLRKIVHPFMLRRTKDQVAKDLPAKTEMILWCEMDKKQRTIYNTLKDHYRNAVMGKIEEEGMGKSGIYILQGLLKLRQICNSPALLSEEEKYPNISVKLEELMRELEENTGDHKVLVFSQFTSMLDLIEKELKVRKMAYSYLDGSTSQKNRKIAVENFQNEPAIRIFLISLMAGGVGLNLTEADYVYLVDPWWNPAAEQQAIDRTHRIGQKKNVFAYKMICKDSVEERILELQKRKKDLAADLITEETGFVKKLSKDDVQFLFS